MAVYLAVGVAYWAVAVIFSALAKVHFFTSLDAQVLYIAVTCTALHGRELNCTPFFLCLGTAPMLTVMPSAFVIPAPISNENITHIKFPRSRLLALQEHVHDYVYGHVIFVRHFVRPLFCHLPASPCPILPPPPAAARSVARRPWPLAPPAWPPP